MTQADSSEGVGFSLVTNDRKVPLTARTDQRVISTLTYLPLLRMVRDLATTFGAAFSINRTNCMPPLPFQQLVREEYLKIDDLHIPQIHCDNFVPELSEVDQVVWLVVHFDGEVLNGGLEQWLLNPTGEFPFETLKALDRIGAVVSAGLFRAVLAMFPDRQISKDQEERERQYDSLTDEQRIQIDKLSDVYGCAGGREHGRIFELVYDFVQKNRSAAADGKER